MSNVVYRRSQFIWKSCASNQLVLGPLCHGRRRGFGNLHSPVATPASAAAQIFPCPFQTRRYATSGADVELTSVRYPNIKRGQFAKVKSGATYCSGKSKYFSSPDRDGPWGKYS